MSSGYFVGDDCWWVSNGSANLLDASWARWIRARGAAGSPDAAALVAFLDELVEMDASGMLGFHFDTNPQVSPVARHTLRVAIEDFAREFVAATRGEIRHEDLAFVPRLDRAYVVWWVASHYALHEMILTAIGDETLAPLDLGLEPDLESAARGTRWLWPIRMLESARRYPDRGLRVDTQRELAVRRSQIDHWSRSGTWITSAARTKALYELADLEESLGALADAAEHTEQAAALEESEIARTTALELAQHRRAMAGGAR